MEKHVVTLVTTDLDGTLLNSQKEVSKGNREAILQLKERGILFGISSGRPVETIRVMVEQWGLSKDVAFIVGMNGGAIYDVRQDIKEDYYLMDGEVAIDVIEFFKDLDVIFQVLIGKDRYVNRATEETKASAVLYGETEIVCDLKEFLTGRKVNKIMMYFKPDYQYVVEQRALQYHNEKCTGCFTANCLYEYMDPHINKGFGIEMLAKHFGTDVEHIVAFGDDSNDMEMLKTAGKGVAMKNARNRVKEVADVVSQYTNDEDAVAHYIKDYVIKEAEYVKMG